MSRGRRLVEALAAVASRYAPEDERQKCALLESVEGCAIRHGGTLLPLHETLCFLQAYPDTPTLLALVDRALEGFAAPVERPGPPAPRRRPRSRGAHTPPPPSLRFSLARR